MFKFSGITKTAENKDWAKVKSSWSDVKRDWPNLGKKWRANKQSPLLAHESPDTSKTYIHTRVHDTQLAVTPPAKSEVLAAKLDKSKTTK